MARNNDCTIDLSKFAVSLKRLSPSIPAHSCAPRFGRSRRAALLSRTGLVSAAAALLLAPGAPAIAGGAQTTAQQRVMNVLNSAPASTQLPVFKALTSGNATISQSGSQLTVTQTTNSASLNWSSFDIGSQAGVTFVQPGTSSIALNRILSGDGSVILGRLTANGQVILINPNGIVFGDGAQVNVGGLIASTLNISDTDFQNGTLVFQRGTATGSVTNAGSIVAAPGGYVALLAPHIANTGLIQANLGTVALASGDAVTLTLAGSGSLGVKVNPATVQSLIEAGGVIQAGGGKVLLTAQAANTLMGGAINATGVIEANSLTSQGGAIVLDGSGAVTLAGAKLDASGATGGGAITVGGWQTASVAVDAASTLDASAKISGNGGKISVIGGTNSFVGSAKATGGALGGDGGSIETSGHILNIDGAKVDAGAPKGKAGTWLLDPWDLTVDAAAAATIDGSLATTNVTLQTTATGASGPGIANASGVGDINIDSPLAWSANTTLTLDAYHSVNVNANIVGTNLNVLYNDGGTGGNLITGTGDSITLGGATPSLTINGSAYTLITTASQLQNAVNANLAGDYALDGNLDLTGFGNFTPIGYVGIVQNASPGIFTGTFDGLGNTITDVTVNVNIGAYYLGLFSAIGTSGTVRNLNLAGGSVTGGGAPYFGFGMLAGINEGNLINVSASGSVSGGVGSSALGGLVGINYLGSINNSSASGPVNGDTEVGGLVGANMGSINNSFASGNVTAEGGGGGTGIVVAGGLAGYNGPTGTITNSSASGVVGAAYVGSVSAYGFGAAAAGGLVGWNDGGTISTSSASGAVEAAAFGTVVSGAEFDLIGGGLVGYNTGTVSQSSATGALTELGNGTLIGGGISTTHAFGYFGGLVGFNGGNGSVSNAYETGNVQAIMSTTQLGNVQATNYVGGFVGVNAGAITDTYAIGALSGTLTIAGGFAGANAGTIVSSYWDINTSGQIIGVGIGSSAGVTGITNAQAVLPSTYVGWNPAIWTIDPGVSAPTLVQ